MEDTVCFEATNETGGTRGKGASATPNGARLRENLREALSQLAAAASAVLRRTPGVPPWLTVALSRVRLCSEAYCDHLSSGLEPELLGRGEFGAVLAGHLRSFRARQHRELLRLEHLVQQAPHSAGVAHAVNVAALVLLADLDAHVGELALLAPQRAA
jgi:hypothetical protein